MMEFKITNTMTNAKIKAQVKAEVTEVIMNALKAAYGDDYVKMVRTGSATSKTNEIGAVVGTADKNGVVNDICITVGATVKEFETRNTAKKTYVAFDFEAAANEYNEYLEAQSAKAAERAAKKKEKED